MTVDPDRCCCGGDDDHGHLVGCPAVDVFDWSGVMTGAGAGAPLRIVFIGMDLSSKPDLTWPPRLSGRKAIHVIHDGLTP
ncbi:MAG: hypothetical protein EON89_00990 [Brevundimonas sp.]|nr:MAG: hypothetical protein EON89_00990 [Brevundimonas sp.]